MTKRTIVAWHGLHAGEAVRLLDTELETDLSEVEARKRLANFGLNQITRRRGTPEWKRFLLQFPAPLVYILLVAASITTSLGEWIDVLVAVCLGVTLPALPVQLLWINMATAV